MRSPRAKTRWTPWPRNARGTCHPRRLVVYTPAMNGFFIRLLISAFSLWVASKLVPGMAFDSTGTLLVAAFVLGFVNAFIRPLFILLTLPLTLMTLGIFLLVINGLMMLLVSALLPGFELHGLLPAILASLVSGFAGWFATSLIGPTGRIEVIVARQRP